MNEAAVQRKILVADVKNLKNGTISHGHYFTLAQNYLDMFEAVAPVQIAGGPVYRQRFQQILQLPYDEIASQNILLKKYHILKNCFELFSQAGDSLLVMQSNAVATIYISLLFTRKKLNIYMIQYNPYSIDSPIKRLLYGMVRHKICGVICPTDCIGQAYGRPYFLIPDYCPTKKTLQKLPLALHEKKYDIGLLGSINAEKGVIEAARALMGTSVSVIISGKPNPPELGEELQEIAAQSPNMHVDLGYISEEKYDAYIKSCRYCILNYTDAYSVHSSGVVFDILYRGTPVIGRRCTTLQFVEEQGLGIIYDEIGDVNWNTLLQQDESQYLRQIRSYLEQQLHFPRELYQFLLAHRKQ